MHKNLIYHTLYNYKTYSGVRYKKLDTSYQVFGKTLHTAPVVLVNHALTGNSNVAGISKGWWRDLIGKAKLIDTDYYTVIAINIPGNGYDGKLISNYKDFTAKDIANIFIQLLKAIGIEKLYAVIGGSLGGGIAWEMAVLAPRFINYLIPVAANWQSSDWIIGHNHVQESILNNSKKPLQDARKMAILFYRTPLSFTKKFQRSKSQDNQYYNIASWLNHHGEKLEKRFRLTAYKMMNHLLTTIDISNGKTTLEAVVSPIQSHIIQIAVNTDLFFIKEENLKTKAVLDTLSIPNQYHEIQSIHGHDAFLIEHEQISHFLTPIFSQKAMHNKDITSSVKSINQDFGK